MLLFTFLLLLGADINKTKCRQIKKIILSLIQTDPKSESGKRIESKNRCEKIN